MKTQALLVADDPVYRRWLQDAAGETLDVHASSAREASALLAAIDSGARAGQPDLVFCEFDERNLAQRAALVERLLERYPQLPVVGLGASDNADLVLAAMRAGARDFFVLRRDDATLPVQIGRLLRRSAGSAAAAAPAVRPGRIYGVASADPHESIAFVAEHLALALLDAAPGKRVLLLDLATPAGAAAVFLNLTQGYGVLNALSDAHRCDETLVDTAFTRHASGLYVLSLPEDLPGRPHIDKAELLRLLKVLSGLFAHIVVTLDGHLPLTTLAGFAEAADRLLLLSDQSILKSRHNKYWLRALRQEGCALDRAGVVVDNYRRGLGLEPQNLATLVDLPLLGVLPGYSVAHVASMNAGEPLSHKDSFWLAIQPLAAMLAAGQALARPVQGGLIKRLLG